MHYYRSHAVYPKYPKRRMFLGRHARGAQDWTGAARQLRADAHEALQLVRKRVLEIDPAELPPELRRLRELADQNIARAENVEYWARHRKAQAQRQRRHARVTAEFRRAQSEYDRTVQSIAQRLLGRRVTLARLANDDE